ncbi:hypothetical protein D3C75_949830 [compost metagenome]
MSLGQMSPQRIHLVDGTVILALAFAKLGAQPLNLSVLVDVLPGKMLSNHVGIINAAEPFLMAARALLVLALFMADIFAAALRAIGPLGFIRHGLRSPR